MSRLRLLPALAALLAMCLAGCGGPTRPVTEETGYEGQAKRDPFLAAARFLEKCGYPTTSLGEYRPRPTSTTIVAPAEAFGSLRDSQRAIHWAGSGGHLIVLLQGGEQWIHDWQQFHGGRHYDYRRKKKDALGKPLPEDTDEDDDNDSRPPIMKELGVRPSEGAQDTERVTIQGKTYEAAFHEGFRLTKHSSVLRPDFSVGPKDQFQLYSYRYGTGRITIFSSAHPFRNRYLGDYDHAALLHALVELTPCNEVVFLSALRLEEGGWGMGEFLKKLWDTFWMAILALAVLIGFWVWKNLVRFGPAHAPEDHAARSFTESLLLTGAFLWRYRMTHALLEPMRRDIETTLASRGLSLGDSAVLADLAQRTSLTVDRLQLAIAGDLPADGQGFKKLVEDLQLIRTKL